MNAAVNWQMALGRGMRQTAGDIEHAEDRYNAFQEMVQRRAAALAAQRRAEDEARRAQELHERQQQEYDRKVADIERQRKALLDWAKLAREGVELPPPQLPAQQGLPTQQDLAELEIDPSGAPAPSSAPAPAPAPAGRPTPAPGGGQNFRMPDTAIGGRLGMPRPDFETPVEGLPTRRPASADDLNIFAVEHGLAETQPYLTELHRRTAPAGKLKESLVSAKVKTEEARAKAQEALARLRDAQVKWGPRRGGGSGKGDGINQEALQQLLEFDLDNIDALETRLQTLMQAAPGQYDEGYDAWALQARALNAKVDDALARVVRNALKTGPGRQLPSRITGNPGNPGKSGNQGKAGKKGNPMGLTPPPGM